MMIIRVIAGRTKANLNLHRIAVYYYIKSFVQKSMAMAL